MSEHQGGVGFDGLCFQKIHGVVRKQIVILLVDPLYPPKCFVVNNDNGLVPLNKGHTTHRNDGAGCKDAGAAQTAQGGSWKSHMSENIQLGR